MGMTSHLLVGGTSAALAYTSGGASLAISALTGILTTAGTHISRDIGCAVGLEIAKSTTTVNPLEKAIGTLAPSTIEGMKVKAGICALAFTAAGATGSYFACDAWLFDADKTETQQEVQTTSETSAAVSYEKDTAGNYVLTAPQLSV